MAKIKIEGLDKLEKRLKQNAALSDVKRVVRKNAIDLHKKVVKNAGEENFKKGYFTGNLKQNVSGQGLVFKDGDFSAEVGTTVEYGPYLEYGTRFMEKEPFIKPALDDVTDKFMDDMKKLVK